MHGIRYDRGGRIKVEQNPGIIAAGIEVTYDQSRLKLLQAGNGVVFSDAMMNAGNNRNAMLYVLLWDDDSSKNHTKSGMLAVLRFEVLSDAENGFAEVGIKLRESSTFNAAMQKVPFSVVNGGVKVSEKCSLKVETVLAAKGSRVSVPVHFANNPGTTVTANPTHPLVKMHRIDPNSPQGSSPGRS